MIRISETIEFDGKKLVRVVEAETLRECLAAWHNGVKFNRPVRRRRRKTVRKKCAKGKR